MWAAHRGEIGHVDPKFSKKFFSKIDNNIIELEVFWGRGERSKSDLERKNFFSKFQDGQRSFL